MIRVGAVGQLQRPASNEALHTIRAEALPPLVPRPRGAVEAGSTVRPPAV